MAACRPPIPLLGCLFSFFFARRFSRSPIPPLCCLFSFFLSFIALLGLVLRRRRRLPSPCPRGFSHLRPNRRSEVAAYHTTTKKERNPKPERGIGEEDRVPTCTSRILEGRSGGQVGSPAPDKGHDRLAARCLLAEVLFSRDVYARLVAPPLSPPRRRLRHRRHRGSAKHAAARPFSSLPAAEPSPLAPERSIHRND